MSLRRFELYTWGPGQQIESRSVAYRTGMFIVRVRATDITEAYRILGRQQWSHSEYRGAGIVCIDHSEAKMWPGQLR